LLSATTLTKASCPDLAHIHDRNPVLLSADTFDAWLDPHIEGDQDLLDEIAIDSDLVAGEAEFFAVGAEVGQVRNNSESLIKAL
jgi:putative SOS response-associated peptidase YedK